MTDDMQFLYIFIFKIYLSFKFKPKIMNLNCNIYYGKQKNMEWTFFSWVGVGDILEAERRVKPIFLDALGQF